MTNGLVSLNKQLCIISSFLSVIFQEIPKYFKASDVPRIFVAKRIVVAVESVAMDHFLSVHTAGPDDARPTIDPVHVGWVDAAAVVALQSVDPLGHHLWILFIIEMTRCDDRVVRPGTN